MIQSSRPHHFLKKSGERISTLIHYKTLLASNPNPFENLPTYPQHDFQPRSFLLHGVGGRTGGGKGCGKSGALASGRIV
jgi:hypothetical protein